jgi:hypothetical protein
MDNKDNIQVHQFQLKEMCQKLNIDLNPRRHDVLNIFHVLSLDFRYYCSTLTVLCVLEVAEYVFLPMIQTNDLQQAHHFDIFHQDHPNTR